MPLAGGMKLGPCEILSLIGTVGMGQVYMSLPELFGMYSAVRPNQNASCRRKS